MARGWNKLDEPKSIAGFEIPLSILVAQISLNDDRTARECVIYRISVLFWSHTYSNEQHTIVRS